MRARPLRSGVTAAVSLLMAVAIGLLALPASGQVPEVGAEVAVGDDVFTPQDVQVAVGESVEWTWVGSNSHNVTSADESFVSDTQTEGMFVATLEQPGIVSYFCTIHGGMEGTITVGEAGEEPPVEPVTPGTDPAPVSGDDPVETALTWSAQLPDGGANTALIGTDADFADSLASGAAQGLLDAPLLLTDRDVLDPRVSDELARLGVDRVVVLGGVAAISEAVEADLSRTVMTIERAGGDTRLETARGVADLVAPDATSVIIARAFGEGSAGFADSLGAGAAAALTGSPVVLTPTDALDPDLATWLTDNGVDQAVIAGGVNAISQQVEADLDALGITTTRYAGGTRFSTAVALQEGAADPASAVTVVEGTGDLAWASGFAAALTSPGGILLSAVTDLPGDTTNALFSQTEVVCGPTIGDVACAQAEAAAAVDLAEPAPLTAVMDVAQQLDAVETGASGVATVYAAGEDAVCFSVTNYDLSGPIAMSHVHAAPAGTAGPVVVPFVLGAVDGSPAVVACSPDLPPAVVAAVYADPAGHYVNIHTELNPMGEVRGQLFPLGPVLEATMTGAKEIPGPGDPAATGSFRLFDTGAAGQLCYVIDQGGLDPTAAAAHIHEGDAATAGPIVHELTRGAGGLSAHCDQGVEAALVNDIFANPSQHYANYHNMPFPAGAIRGQLDGS